MERKELRVIVCKVGQDPQVQMIKNTLEAKKQIVEGWLEYHQIPGTNFALFLNEESKLTNEPEPSLEFFMEGQFYDVACGSYIVINDKSDNDGNERDITDKQIAEFMDYYNKYKVVKDSFKYNHYKRQIQTMF